jgi:hypothetical protein
VESVFSLSLLLYFLLLPSIGFPFAFALFLALLLLFYFSSFYPPSTCLSFLIRFFLPLFPFYSFIFLASKTF